LKKSGREEKGRNHEGGGLISIPETKGHGAFFKREEKGKERGGGVGKGGSLQAIQDFLKNCPGRNLRFGKKKGCRANDDGDSITISTMGGRMKKLDNSKKSKRVLVTYWYSLSLIGAGLREKPTKQGKRRQPS